MIEYMRDWWTGKSDRTPLLGRLTDAAALVGRYNRALSVNAQRGASLGLSLPANSNRVLLAAYADTFALTAAVSSILKIFNELATVQLFGSQIVAKQIDTALVTPSPMTYNPAVLTIADYGPLLLGQVTLSNSGGGLNVYLIEVSINPELNL